MLRISSGVARLKGETKRKCGRCVRFGLQRECGVARFGAVHRPGSGPWANLAISTIHHTERRWVEEEMR